MLRSAEPNAGRSRIEHQLTGELCLRARLRTILAIVFACAGVALLCLRPLPTVRGSDISAFAGPTYQKDGSLLVPANYREWTYLTSGIDMVYGQNEGVPAHSRFDNVFVNPEAYHHFLAAGTWPDKTMLILEVRGAETNASINHGGHSQSTELLGMEVHVKDQARFQGGWAFFDVAKPGVAYATGQLIPQPASCYSCHQAHAAVDTTFVQFYPTLLPIAKLRNTLSSAYLQDSAASH